MCETHRSREEERGVRERNRKTKEGEKERFFPREAGRKETEREGKEGRRKREGRQGSWEEKPWESKKPRSGKEEGEGR